MIIWKQGTDYSAPLFGPDFPPPANHLKLKEKTHLWPQLTLPSSLLHLSTAIVHLDNVWNRVLNTTAEPARSPGSTIYFASAKSRIRHARATSNSPTVNAKPSTFARNKDAT